MLRKNSAHQESQRPASAIKTIVAATLADIGIALTKFVAAAVTGSSTLLAEGIHSVVDLSNGIFVYIGLKQSSRPADNLHPFGYSREIYFWTFVVAVMIFGVGGGLSIYEGIEHLYRPVALKHIRWNYFVIGVAFVFEGLSFWVATKEFSIGRRSKSFWSEVHNSKDPSIFIFIFEDGAALGGLTIALAGIALSQYLSSPVPDAVASILIGGLLIGVSLILLYETHGLLLGEAAQPELLSALRQEVQNEQGVENLRNLLSVHLGPNEIVVDLKLKLKKEVSAEKMIATVRRIKRLVREHHPKIKFVFVDLDFA